MAIVIAGSDPTNRTNIAAGGFTNIILSGQDFSSTPSIRGVIKSFDSYLAAAGTFKIKVFYDDGTNYVFIGESETTASLGTGLTSGIPIWLPIERSYLIGWYSATGDVDSGAVAGLVRQAGDITTTTTKASWGALARTPTSLKFYLSSRSAPILI